MIMKIVVCSFVVICQGLYLSQGIYADEVSDLRYRIRQLVEENQALKRKIAAMESTVELQREPGYPGVEADNKKSLGWFTAEYQFDTRGFNTINFTGASDMPLGFTIWGFTDIETADIHGSRSSRKDAEEFFLEIDLRRELYKGFGVIAEYNDNEGANNNIGRLGFNYKAGWGWLKDRDISLYFKAFPLETDGHGSQVSFSWNKKFPDTLDGRFSMGGFFDTNFDSGLKDDEINIVSDTQFRYRLINHLEALVEFRFNEFMPANQEHGFGIGLKYRY
ncbi:MAG: hypothetical protein SCARUB_02614 [Candidatus Scalindua rubra]|uniref:Uncharacterized protein n=1 Tax=Candidatus Scalindua rubra TaxID=1872076 RepID=A0A1E3X9F1_9BACT|nr:MAG: hypothetical protein SCARUB_02614 [Candidatus Scalindua rubra]